MLDKIFKEYDVVYDGKYYSIDFEIGDKVIDCLTDKLATIVKITGESPILGYWIDNDYLGGGRHPWEMIKLRKRKQC